MYYLHRRTSDKYHGARVHSQEKKSLPGATNKIAFSFLQHLLSIEDGTAVQLLSGIPGMYK